MVSCVEYVPVPPMTLPLPDAASTTARNRSPFSSWVRVGASPVEPAATMVSVPFSSSQLVRFCAPSRSNE